MDEPSGPRPLATAGIGALVLAAGAGRRFGGAKQLAMLDGRPLLQHVLDTLAAVEPLVVRVVLPPSLDTSVLDLRGARPIVNPDPGRGLSSSLRLGIWDLASEPGLEALLVVLGDQPRTTRDTMLALAAALPEARAVGAVAVVPDYPTGGMGGNPVLLARAGFPLVGETRGDRGLGPLLAQRPELVWRVAVGGTNPDVDTRADLAALDATGLVVVAGPTASSRPPD